MSIESDERLYAMIRDLRDEVQGYRRDLNGRLRKLEQTDAARTAHSEATTLSKNQVVAWVSLSIAAGGLFTAILTQVISKF
jgi:hypothetical protein